MNNEVTEEQKGKPKPNVGVARLGTGALAGPPSLRYGATSGCAVVPRRGGASGVSGRMPETTGWKPVPPQCGLVFRGKKAKMEVSVSNKPILLYFQMPEGRDAFGEL
jgi:hypothetical protein